ncbi:MAG: SPASM domain-containing protein [Bacteroides sp.]|nr:SPASM domain-containing protein [Bacteroides sp.]
MISRCYLEITNVCNLDCLFCPKTSRAKRILSAEEFEILTDRLCGRIRFLYFHLMGEPTLHPLLPDFVRKAREKNLVPVITTNGTRLQKAEKLIEARPHKIQISLHAYEGNGKEDVEQYIKEVMLFAGEAARQGVIVVLRLWNQGGYDSANERIKEEIARYQLRPWTLRNDGWKLAENLYLEYDRMFEWPDGDREAYTSEGVFCYALRNQIGILVDGSVVPCCLDHDGELVLGNLFEQPLDGILASPRARTIYDGFTNHIAVEPLCRRCGYAVVTKQFRK